MTDLLRRFWRPLTAILFVALALLAFGRSLTQDFAPLDDDLLITGNLTVRGMNVENLKLAFTTFDPELYIPLTFVSYQIDYLIGGLQPWVFHLTNIFLHAINGLLVAWVLMMLTGRRGLSIFGGLIFLVHPLQTEAVVWAAARKDLLSTMFFLGAFLSYLYYRRGERWGMYGLAVMLFLLALLSKVMTVTLPMILLMHDFLMEKRAVKFRPFLEKIPHVIIAGIFVWVATLGKERILAKSSMLETALMAAKSTGYYLLKILLPWNLGVFYPYRGDISLLLPDFFVPLAILVALVALVLYFGRFRPWLVFGAGFFIVTLAPTFINFHKGGEIYFASDRYPYLPMVGLLLLIVMGLQYVTLSGAKRDKRPSRFAALTMTSLILLLTFLSHQQTKLWDSAVTLFERTLNLYPHSIAARVGLASIDRQTGRVEKAIRLLREGLSYGDSVPLRVGLGTAYAKVGRVDDAVEQFNLAMNLEPENPDPLYALASIDEHFKRTDAVKEKLRKAIELDPSFVAARNKLAAYLLEEGNDKEAEAQLREALRWNWSFEPAHYNLSLLLEAQGKMDEAKYHRDIARELNPSIPAL